MRTFPHLKSDAPSSPTHTATTSVVPVSPNAVIPTGVSRFIPAYGFCTLGYAVEGSLFDVSPTQANPGNTQLEKLTLSTEY